MGTWKNGTSTTKSPSRNLNATLKKPQSNTKESQNQPSQRILNKPYTIFKTNPDETLINPKPPPKKP